MRDIPEEAILLKVNNKVPGLGLQLDASELNLLYRDRYGLWKSLESSCDLFKRGSTKS